MQKTKNLVYCRIKRWTAFSLALIMCFSLNLVQDVQIAHAAFPDVNGITVSKLIDIPACQGRLA